MPVYLDSAVVGEAEEAERLGFTAGVTTNPTLVLRAAAANRERGLTSRMAVYAALLETTAAGGGAVFAQVRRGSLAAMSEEAERLRGLDPVRLAVKIPCTPEGLQLARLLAAQGTPTLVTAVYTPAQAYLAAEAGATCIAPYVHRWETAHQRPGAEFVAALRRALDAAGGRTWILAASLKSVEAAEEALLAGARGVTLPLAVLRELAAHPLTSQALDQFDADYDAQEDSQSVRR